MHLIVGVFIGEPYILMSVFEPKMKVVLLFAVTGQAIIYSLLLLFIHPRSCVETTSIAETVCWSHQLFVLILRFTLTQICHLEQMMWYCLENSCKRRLFILDNVFEYCKCNLLIIMVHQLDNFVFLIFFTTPSHSGSKGPSEETNFLWLGCPYLLFVFLTLMRMYTISKKDCTEITEQHTRTNQIISLL